MRTNFRLILLPAILFHLSHSSCIGGTVHNRAQAAVAVARAALDLADDCPILPDTRTRNANASIDRSLSLEDSRCDSKLNNYRPVEIVFNSARPQSDAIPAQLVIEHWEHGCPIGDRLVHELRRQLKPLGWTIGESETDQIRLTHVPQTQPCPRIKLLQTGQTVKSWDGYQDPSLLSRELRWAWDEAPTPADSVAAGPAGAIRARPQIQDFLSQWRNRIGEGRRMTFGWDRSGAPSFNLRSKSTFSMKELFGDSGRFIFSAPGAVKLPTEQFGVGYRLQGLDVVIDADPMTFPGMVGSLERQFPQAAASAEPTQSITGVLTVYYLFCMGRDIYQMLTPSCDLLLGGTICGSATLENDKLLIDFREGPMVKIKILFTFPLKISRITITEEQVFVEFTGSRVVRSRTFEVQ